MQGSWHSFDHAVFEHACQCLELVGLTGCGYCMVFFLRFAWVWRGSSEGPHLLVFSGFSTIAKNIAAANLNDMSHCFSVDVSSRSRLGRWPGGRAVASVALASLVGAAKQNGHGSRCSRWWAL